MSSAEVPATPFDGVSGTASREISDGTFHGIKLDPDGAGLVSLRTSRASVTHIFFFERTHLITACTGNQTPGGTGPDYVNGTQGEPDGHYFLLPKPATDYGGALYEYVPGTPSVTGKGFPVGQPGPGYKNTIRFHPCGGSEACQTAPLPWANLVWDLMNRTPERKFHLHLLTLSNPDPVPHYPTPSPKSHPWPAFNHGSTEPYP